MPRTADDDERAPSLRNRTDVLVLCYHAVSPTWPSEIAVDPGALQRQVESLLARGYTPAAFADAVLRTPATRTFSVTFDDGYRSVLEHGVPVLRSLGVPATIFVSTNRIDAQPEPFSGEVHKPFFGTPHERELYAMTWEELRGVADEGWEIGSHAMNHPLLTQIDDERLEHELAGSRARLEAVLARPCETFAYPSGDFDARVAAAVGRAGYAAAGTLPRRFPKVPEPLTWPRVLVKRDDDMRTFRLKTASLVRRARASSAWPLLDAARIAVRRTHA